MESNIAIKLTNLSKVYKLYDNPKDRFKETFHPLRKKYHHDFYALKDISLEVKKGDTIGIIGKNGAGKSTLLQILCKVVTPSIGTVQVNGKVSALLELGSGFNPEFTGIENIYFYGSIVGYSKENMDKKLNDILAFADIGEFVYQPMKTYSTGMFVRLAFSAATMMEPEILIVDEALSVGDIFFQAKCMNKIRKMIDKKNITLLFVSHDLTSIKSICKKTICLDSGKIIDYGESAKVVDEYFSMKMENEQKVIAKEINKAINVLGKSDRNLKDKKYKLFENNKLFLKKASFQRIQNGKASIINVQLLDEREELIFSVKYEQKLILRMAIEIYEDIHSLDHGYAIRNENGVEVVVSDSILENKSLYNVKKGDKFIIDWCFRSSLTDSNYTITTGLVIFTNYEKLQFEFCDRVPISVQFNMQRRPWFPILGLSHWDNEVDILKI